MDRPVLSIDVSKSQSYAAALLGCLSKLEMKTGKKPQVVLEATGNYSKPLVSFFQRANYEVVVLNPLETHQQKKKCIRKVKTDPVDANRIAQVYYQKSLDPAAYTDPFTLELRNLCRQYEGFNILYTEAQLRFRSILDLLFPNFDRVFSHIRGVTALNVLFSFPSPQAVLSASREDLLAALKPAKHSASWCEKKADQLILAAKESLPANQAQQSNIWVLKNYIDILLTHQRIMTDI